VHLLIKNQLTLATALSGQNFKKHAVNEPASSETFSYDEDTLAGSDEMNDDWGQLEASAILVIHLSVVPCFRSTDVYCMCC
jgi:hypothetical protein